MKFYHLQTEAEIRALIRYHNKMSDFVVLDTETTSKDARKADLIDIQMSGKYADEAAMFGAEFAPLLLEIEKPLVFWNHKYDVKVLYRHGVDLRSKEIIDPMLIDHLVDENREHRLDSHVQELFDDDYKEKFWEKYKSYEEAPFDERLEYGCKDIVFTTRVYQRIAESAKRQDIPQDLTAHVHRLARALLSTEIEGLKVDLDYTIQMGSELKADIVRTEAELRKQGGVHCDIIELGQWSKDIEKFKTDKRRATVPKPDFNFASSDQVGKLLYEQLKLPPQFNKKTKNRTADDKALESLEHLHPIIPGIRTLRKYNKMYGAFIEGILDKVDDGRIYPSFNVSGTVTGRISHSEPNMGQMPSKGEWAKIRGVFIPDPGHKIITCDYGQLEICLTAHFSQDETLCALVRSGESMHDKTTAELAEFGVTRGQSKGINFGIVYGALEHKIASIVGCSLERAKEILDKFWSTYPGIKTAIFECHAKVERGEPIVSPYGRRRRFFTKFADRWEEQRAKRQAFNALVQGTGADLTSYSFYTVAEELRARGWGRALFSVHDEVLAHVEDEYVEDARRLIQDVMINAGREINLRVPLSVDCSEGLSRWQK